MLGRFLSDERGAVTVDWVMITAGIVGLGLATTAVVTSGVQDISEETAGTMSGYSIRTTFASVGSIFSSDFSSGLGEWVGGVVANVPGFGDVLQLGPGTMASLTLAVPPGASSATITFDMLGVDDLSGEAATIFINGQPVALYADSHGHITTTDLDTPGVTIGVQQLYTNSAMGGGDHGHDSRASYTITIDNPGDSITFGVGSSSGQPITEEFYAIDDVEIVAG